MEIKVIDKEEFSDLMLDECALGSNTPISVTKHPEYFNIMSTIWQYNDITNQILRGVIAIAEYGDVIHDMLVYVDKKLYIQDPRFLKWYADTSTLEGLRQYLLYENGVLTTLREIRAIIGICTKFGFIAEMSEDDFRTRMVL